MADGKLATFVWTLKNFHMCPHLTGQPLYSPEFKIGSYGFCLHLFPRGRQDPKYVSLFIERLNDCGSPDVLVKAQICVLGDSQDNVSEYCHWSFKKNLKTTGNWGCDWIKQDVLLITERATHLPNNNLIIKCDMLSLSEYEETNTSRIKNKFDNDHDAEILSHDFRTILSSGIYSDMVLIINENKFKVHKSILNCRCPKIMSLLKETELPDEYALYDMEAPVLKILLQYLYTGTFDVANMYEEMFMVSNTYDIPHLEHFLTFLHYKVIHATTEIAVSDLSFRWVINNFSKLQVNEDVVYPTFYTTSGEWSKIKVVLRVIKRQSRSTRVQLRLRKLTSNKVAFIRCKICIARRNFTTPAVYKYEFILEPGEDCVPPFGSEIELSQFLFSDTFDVFFEISMSKLETKSEIKAVFVDTRKDEEEGVMKNLKVLQKDLGSLYDDKSSSGDITLRVGDAKFAAHKFIMCARSPVFTKMFENNTLEKKEGVVTIEDIDAQTVSSMLRYIYSGYIDAVDISHLIKLYAAADKYEILTLRNTCSHFLKAYMDAAHIGEVLLLADAHYDDDLRSSVYDYMISNPDEVLKSKDGLSVLKNRLDVYPDILNAFLEHASSNASKNIESIDRKRFASLYMSSYIDIW